MQPLEELFLSQLQERTAPIYAPLLQQGIVRPAEMREEIMQYFTSRKPGLLDVYSRYADEWNAWHEMSMLQGSHFLSSVHRFQHTFGLAYSPEELNIRYYVHRLENTFGEKFSSLRQLFMDRWRRILFDREYAWQLRYVEHLCDTFVRKIQQQCDALLNQGERGTDVAPRLQWLTPRQDPELRIILMKLARIMARNRVCHELERILGRRRSDLPATRRAIQDFQSRHQIRYASPSDIVGVTEGAQLGRLLPMEYGLMADSATELLFLRRFADHHLQMFDSYTHLPARVRPSEERGTEIAVPQAEGPFVVCVDSSGSMSGQPELLAKALVLAVAMIAEQVHRRCAVVLFSDQIEVMEFSDLAEGLPLMVRFFCESFHGGTDARLALGHAASILETTDFALADLLLLSDCAMESPSAVLNQRITRLRQRGTRFYTVLFGNDENEYYTQMSDKYWRL